MSSKTIQQFFEQIASDILSLNTDLMLLRSWGAQPELWLRNQIALMLYRRYSASSIYIGCEVSYQNSNEKIDLIINRGVTYYIEIKIENEFSRNRDWLGKDSSPLVQDAQKILQFRPNKAAHRCLIAVAFKALRINDLRALYNDAAPNIRVFKEMGGQLAVLVQNLDNL